MFKAAFCALVMSALVGAGTMSSDAHAQAAKAVKQYIYILKLADRLHDPKAWTERDNASVAAHFNRLKDATAARKVILAGRSDEPLDKTFGVVIFEASTDSEALEFMESDPAVVDGVMLAKLHPYSVALMRK